MSVVEEMTRDSSAATPPASAASQKARVELAGVRILALKLVLPALLLATWMAASVLAPSMATVLPSPVAVLWALWEKMASGELAGHVGASLGRAVVGFFIAAAIGIALGLVMSQSRLLRELLSGPVELLRPISSIAWIPLAILWFGIGFKSVVFVIVISCIFIIVLNTLAAAGNVDRDLIKSALTLGANRRQLFTKVVLPSAVPGIMLGLRIAMTGAWGGVLIAEMIATSQGLGYMIVRAQASYQPEVVIGGMVVVGIVGYLLNMLFVLAQRRITHE